MNLKQRFRKFTDPNVPDHSPLYLAATLPDLRYKLPLNPTQLNLAKKEILKQLKAESGNSGSGSSSSSLTSSGTYF